jgi:hypothetical protein
VLSAFVAQAFEAAIKRPLPAAAEKCRLPEMKQLVALFRELQEARQDMNQEGFYLGCRDVGRLFDVSHVTGWGWLATLESGGIIRCVVRGSLKSGMASQYRYLGD